MGLLDDKWYTPDKQHSRKLEAQANSILKGKKVRRKRGKRKKTPQQKEMDKYRNQRKERGEMFKRFKHLIGE